MPKVIITSADVAEAKIDRRSTLMRKMAEMACGQALSRQGYGNGCPTALYAGIVGYTIRGEEYPELWRSSHYRILPYQFGAGILNSVIGHCSIMFHLTGPQILVTTPGSMVLVAHLQIEMARSRLMVMLDYSDPARVEVDVLRNE